VLLKISFAPISSFSLLLYVHCFSMYTGGLITTSAIM